MNDEYWFAVQVRFECRVCQRNSLEKMAVSAPIPDPNSINRALHNQQLSCQLCKAPLADGTPVHFDVRASTLEDLKRDGFLNTKE